VAGDVPEWENENLRRTTGQGYHPRRRQQISVLNVLRCLFLRGPLGIRMAVKLNGGYVSMNAGVLRDPLHPMNSLTSGMGQAEKQGEDKM
jgi:hypothetical protein